MLQFLTTYAPYVHLYCFKESDNDSTKKNCFPQGSIEIQQKASVGDGEYIVEIAYILPQNLLTVNK